MARMPRHLARNRIATAAWIAWIAWILAGATVTGHTGPCGQGQQDQGQQSHCQQDQGKQDHCQQSHCQQDQGKQGQAKQGQGKQGQAKQGQAKEIVEHHEDNGAVHRRYRVDAEGRKEGELLEYAKDGTLRIRARYKADKLDGSYFSFHDNGKRKLRASYRDGMLWGSYTAFRPDGTRHLTAHYYKDKLHGKFERVYRNRQVKVRTRYLNGVLHGKFESYHEDGKPHVLTTYDQGQRHGEYAEYNEAHTRILTAVFDHEIRDGPYKLVQDGEVRIDHVWKQGRIEKIRGVVAYPRPLAEIHTQIQRILAPPGPEAGQKDSPSAQALRRLKAYRFLCGVPYESLRLDDTMCMHARAAAALCKRIGRLEHTPKRPDTMPEEEYRIAYTGTSSCNLHRGSADGEITKALGDKELVDSVDAYMEDAGADNLVHMGHRRWCLNPGMTRTGFGNADLFCAMWAHDQGGPKVNSGMIHHPPPGFVPQGFFGPGHAWSVMFMDRRFLNKARVRIDIHVIRPDYTRSGEKLAIGVVNVHNAEGFPGSCLIFKPVRLLAGPGNRYFVEISLDGGRTVATRYLVEFAEAAG